MASTYSTRLRLEKQGTGDNSNTWGDVANTVFDLIDESIGGYLSKSVAGASDVTLTENNGSADESRNAALEFTGTLTGNINVIVPTSEKIYLVYNNTSGAFTLTVKTSGGSGVAVTQGAKSILLCDGTNVVAWNPTVSELSGTLTVAGGGTGGTTALGAQQSLGVLFSNVVSKSTDYTVLTTDLGTLFKVDATSADVTLTTPAAATAGAGFYFAIQKVDSSTNDAIIDGNASETINGETTLSTNVQYTTQIVISDGTNWIHANFLPSVADQFAIISTNADANSGPTVALTRLSPSPADNDTIGVVVFQGYDDGLNVTNYAVVGAQIADVTNGTEDAVFFFQTMVAGSLATRGYIGNGLVIGSPTGGDSGAGTINAQGEIQKNGQSVHPMLDNYGQWQHQSTGDGGSFSSGSWRTRDISTEVSNNITGASVVSNQLSLPAGTYYFRAWGIGFRCDGHQIRLQDVTNTATLALGSTPRSPSGENVGTESSASGKFTLAGTASIELQHRGASSRSIDGFGQDPGFGTQVYANLEVWRLA